MKELELTFGEDLNSDGTLGPTTTRIATNGATTLTEVASELELNPAGGGTGPWLDLKGSPVIAGRFAAGWTPVRAARTATGHQAASGAVVPNQPGRNPFPVWNADSGGGATSAATRILSGGSSELEGVEAGFGETFPGAGPQATPTLIAGNGATAPAQAGNPFELDPFECGTGALLELNGGAVAAGQFAAGWTLVGALQTETGHEVAFSAAAPNQPGENHFAVRNTNSGGDTSAATGILSGAGSQLEGVEASFGETSPAAGPKAALNTLVSFKNSAGDFPTGSLIADANGDLYGATIEGGAYGVGTVFEIAASPSGYASTPTTLVSFNGSDGGVPSGGLIADANGDLFGTTGEGGENGDGTVFEIAKTSSGYASTPTTLVSFNGSDGFDPTGGLIADANGDLFGTTHGGGANSDGTVFEIAKTASGYANTPTTLVSFNGSDGAYLFSSLILDASRDLFGTTAQGGENGDGTVFEIANSASGYASTPTTLVSFNGGDGGDPGGALIADANGDLFGTTSDGGANGDGTVFEIVKTASGYASTPTILVSFNGSDGGDPSGGLIADADGDLFGTTAEGGANGDGTVFEIANTVSGYASTPTTLVSFNGSDGAVPIESLIADANGNLFSTTLGGGKNGVGTVFEITDSGFVTAATPPPTIAFDDEAPFTSGAAVTMSGTVGDAVGVESVEICNGTTDLGDATINAAQGTWTLATTLAAGFYNDLYAVATDASGATQTAIAPYELMASVTGQPYSAYEQLYDNGVFSGTDYFFTNVIGPSYSSYEYDYSAGNALIGSKFYYTRITGQAYTGEVVDYNGAGLLTSATYTGLTDPAYSAYQYDYVGGVFSGSQFTFTTVPTGASYSSYETDYDQAGNFTGDEFFFTNIQGQSYTGEEEDFDAGGALSSVLLTGIADQAYSSLQLDYSAGAYEGYQAYYTGITGRSYTSEEVDVSAAGQLEKVVYSGMTSTPYSSVEQDYSAGTLADVIYDFTNVTGASYNSYQVEDNASGAALQETLDLNSGGHHLIALAGGQTLTSLGDDVMTGSATGSTTFVLNAIYGADTIANLTGSDIVSMPKSEFSGFPALLAAASFASGSAVITAGDGDTLTLKGVTSTMLLQELSGDFTFHA
jgi:uncharacterized repeat protein (TIGR03803 family)